MPEQFIKEHLLSLPQPKQSEMQELHRNILNVMPNCKLWFDHGKNAENKTVTNPTIGYGVFDIKYANGSSKEFFQVGISANKSGISVYILGISDKTFLSNSFSQTIGKAKITSYCIKFKSLKDIHLNVLLAAIKQGLNFTQIK